VEADVTRVAMLQNNVDIVGCGERVTIHHASYLSVCHLLEQDVVYLDAPWGGPSYKDMETVDLFLDGVPLVDVCARVWDRTKLIALKVPKNFGILVFKAAAASMLPRGQIVVVSMGHASLVLIRKK